MSDYNIRFLDPTPSGADYKVPLSAAFSDGLTFSVTSGFQEADTDAESAAMSLTTVSGISFSDQAALVALLSLGATSGFNIDAALVTGTRGVFLGTVVGFGDRFMAFGKDGTALGLFHNLGEGQKAIENYTATHFVNWTTTVGEDGVIFSSGNSA